MSTQFTVPAVGETPWGKKFSRRVAKLLANLPEMDTARQKAVTRRKRLAGVIVPLRWDGKRWLCVLMRRQSRLKRHPGEISFPGGMLEKEESPLEAAVRETREELGVSSSQIEILGSCRPLVTLSSDVSVFPFVAVLKTGDFTPNSSEVAEILEVPLAKIFSGDDWRRDRVFQVDDWQVQGWALEWRGNRIWGATARILWDFRNLWVTG